MKTQHRQTESRFRSDASEVSDVNSDLRSTTMAVCLSFSRDSAAAVLTLHLEPLRIIC